jgi:hypothetical protein
VTKVLLRIDPKIGHGRVEHMESMSSRRWIDLSCVSFTHQHIEERRKNCKFKMSHLEDIIVENGEAIRNTSPSKHNQERHSISMRSRSSPSSSSGMLKVKVCSSSDF